MRKPGFRGNLAFLKIYFLEVPGTGHSHMAGGDHHLYFMGASAL